MKIAIIQPYFFPYYRHYLRGAWLPSLRVKRSVAKQSVLRLDRLLRIPTSFPSQYLAMTLRMGVSIVIMEAITSNFKLQTSNYK